MRTRVKICGITSIEDAAFAVNAGADAIGLVFYQSSSRYVSLACAQQIVNSLPAFVTVVGLFVNANQTEISQAHKVLKFDLVQYHGDEDFSFCQSVGLPYIKAVRVETKASVDQAFDRFIDAKGILVDAYVENIPGGTGHKFDWQLLSSSNNDLYQKKLILAGGLNPENIVSAISQVSPYAVDVSSGVEKAAGKKSQTKIESFIKGVKHADEIK